MPGLAPLDAACDGLPGLARVELTAERAFKHLVAAVVFATSYVSVEPIMAQGRDGRVIDVVPPTLAPADETALRAAGLLR